MADLYGGMNLGLSYGTGGVADDHGALSGLDDDDHAQYHTDGRGDIRYYTKTVLDFVTAGWIRVQLLAGNTAAQNDTAIDTAITAALAAGLSLYFPPGTFNISQTIALAGHNMTTDSSGTSGENANDMSLFFDNTKFQVDSGAVATDFHECKSYEWVTDGVGTSGYKSVSSLVLRSVEPWDATSEAPIVTGVVAGTSVGVKKYCIFDTRGIQGASMIGRLHIVGNFDGSNSDNIVALGCSQRGLSGNDGQRVVWPHLILENLEIGLYGTPRLGQSASVAARDDGFADCFTAAWFPFIETRGNIGRNFVIGPNKSDGTFIGRATFEGATATSFITNSKLNFGTLRINQKVRNTAQFVAVHITNGRLSCPGDCYVRNNGASAATKGAAGFFHLGDNGKLDLPDLRLDNTDLNASYPYLIKIGTSSNGLKACITAHARVGTDEDVPGRTNLNSVFLVETLSSTNGYRKIEYFGAGAASALTPILIADTGGTTNDDVYKVLQDDVNEEYGVVAGAMVPTKNKVIARSNARTSVDNTLTPTTVLDYTIPQHGLSEVGGHLRITITGDCAVAGATTAALQFAMTIGGTASFDATTELLPGSGTANGRTFKLVIDIWRRGTSTWEEHASLFVSEDGTDTTGRGTFSGWTNIHGGHVARASHSGANLATGSAQILVKANPTVAQSGTRIRVDNYCIERV